MDRGMLARATEGTEAPTPGYLYIDLAKQAASNPVACQEMATYLTRRLQSKNNPNIKYKCCKVLTKLCESVPRNAFRRCVAQHPAAVGAIKEAMAYRGTMDPVRGDQPNQKVRDAAKEALDAVYSEAPSSEQLPGQQAASSFGSNISSSYAPSPHQQQSSSYNGYGRSMGGVGNPRYNDPRLDPRYNGTQPHNIQAAVREAGSVIAGMIKDPLARNVDIPAQPRQGHSGDLPGYNRSSRPPPGSAELARQTGGQWTMASNRGPGAQQEYYKERDTSFQWAQQQQQQSAAPSSSAAAGSVGGSWGAAPAAGIVRSGGASAHVPTVHNLPASGGRAVSDGSYEKNLILELCPPGGMKPVPPPDKLANFARNVPSLNSDLICPVLLDCVEEGQPWVIRAKALHVMQTCLEKGAKLDGTHPYRDFFHACVDEISPLAAHPRAAIATPARRVLELLGVAAAAPTARAAPVAAAPNLLDFDDTPAPSQPPPPPPAAAEAPPSSNMFGGMQVKSSVPSAATATTAAPSAASTTAAAPSSNTNGDLLGDFANNTTTAPSSSENNNPSMFAQMSLKEKAEPKTDEDNIESLAAPANGSAFGFINKNESSAPDTTTTADATKNPESSFDPLKNVTPQTAQRKMMQLSPEQVQAMMYQQNMWQQQQQMQQMQMAMMMGGAMPPQGRMMAPGGGGRPPPQQQQQQQQHQFSLTTRPAKKDDKKFDFVKDAMFNAK